MLPRSISERVSPFLGYGGLAWRIQTPTAVQASFDEHKWHFRLQLKPTQRAKA